MYKLLFTTMLYREHTFTLAVFDLPFFFFIFRFEDCRASLELESLFRLRDFAEDLFFLRLLLFLVMSASLHSRNFLVHFLLYFLLQRVLFRHFFDIFILHLVSFRLQFRLVFICSSFTFKFRRCCLMHLFFIFE